MTRAVHVLSLVAALALFLSLMVYSPKGVSMSLFKSEEVWIFSPMEGVVTFEGRPAAGAKIVRVVKWQSDEGETDEVVTDEAGRFRLSGMTRNLRQMLPAEFVAYQDLYVHYQGEEYHVWVMSKREKGKFGELGGEPVNLRCELTDEIERIEIDRGLLGTSCKWDAISE